MIFLPILSFLALFPTTSANVEKTIFITPEAQALPPDASIDKLLLLSLTETIPTIRTRLNASFPADDNVKGTESWFLLDGLLPTTRYEVRVCWLATVRSHT